METEQARELLAAERERIERELAQVRHEDDGEPADVVSRSQGLSLRTAGRVI